MKTDTLELEKQLKEMELKMLEINNSLEGLQRDMDGITAWIHITWEGIKTGSVDDNEVINALYCLSDFIAIITGRLTAIRKGEYE